MDVAVIGGGASGLMATISAAQQGAHVVILERMDRVGKKILATGNGRCNLTNLNIRLENYHGASSDFIRTVLDQCPLTQTLDHFEKIGLAWQTDGESGRVYPRSCQASSVLDVLRLTCHRLQIEEICNAEVTQVTRKADGFIIILKNGQPISAKKIILAAGGRAAPGLGSNGSGHTLAQKLGHTLVEPFPAIVQLELDVSFIRQLKGVRCDAQISILDGRKTVRTETGEIQFTEYGLSGIPALGMARSVHEIQAGGSIPAICLNLFPEWSSNQLTAHLVNRFQNIADTSIADALISLIHKRLIPVILKQCGIDFHQICGTLTSDDVERLVLILTHWIIQVSGTKSWNEAQVTAGGVDTREVNPETLESKIFPGLFFTGELLDVDGDCGGYNLQWAWSSGWVAGKHAAKKS